MNYSVRPSRALWILFLALAIAGFCLFFIPAFIIRPFRYQSPVALQRAMAIRQVAPSWSVIAAAGAFTCAVVLWRRTSKWGRALVTIAMGLAVASATMSQLNYFEWMFHHLSTPGFEAASASKLADSEMVIAVREG